MCVWGGGLRAGVGVNVGGHVVCGAACGQWRGGFTRTLAHALPVFRSCGHSCAPMRHPKHPPPPNPVRSRASAFMLGTVRTHIPVAHVHSHNPFSLPPLGSQTRPALSPPSCWARAHEETPVRPRAHKIPYPFSTSLYQSLQPTTFPTIFATLPSAPPGHPQAAAQQAATCGGARAAVALPGLTHTGRVGGGGRGVGGGGRG